MYCRAFAPDSPLEQADSNSRSHPLTRRQTHGLDRMNRAERDTVVGSGSLVTLDPGATPNAFFSGQTVGTIAGARRLIRSAYSEAAVLSM